MKTSGPPWTSRLRHYLQRGPGKLAFLQAAAARHRPLVELSLVPPRQRSFLLTEPDDIGHVLQTHHARYRKSNVLTGPRGRQRSGTGLLTGVGQPAITQKRLLQPVLAQAVGPVFDDIIRATTAEWLDAQPPGAWLDVLPAMTALTRRVLGRILFSGDFDREYRPLAQAIAIRQRYIRFVYESVLPFPESWPTRLRRAHRQAIAEFDRVIYPLIAARRRDPAPPTDLLTLFLAARYADGTAMTDQQVRDEVLTMTATGYETVALALAWTLYLTARHPAAQRRPSSVASCRRKDATCCCAPSRS
jgi:cytochrome P450